MTDSDRTTGTTRWKTGTRAAVAALAIALSACGLGDDRSGVTENACDLLTADEIGSATGQAAENGIRSQNLCTWNLAEGAKFTAGILPRGGDEVFDSSVRKGGNPVGGVGDKAVYQREGQFAYLQILKGEMNVRLDYSGATPPDEARMSDLGRKAVERL